jgi:hypothetical protein
MEGEGARLGDDDEFILVRKNDLQKLVQLLDDIKKRIEGRNE